MTTIESGFLEVSLGSEGTYFTHAGNRQSLLRAPGGWPLLPELNGAAPKVGFESVQKTEKGFCLVLKSAGAVSRITIFGKVEADALDLWCELRAEEACELNAIRIMPPGTGLGFYDVVNFRNRHHTAATWPEFPVGREGETTTYSNDWQFAPHPSALLLRKEEVSLFAGFADLQASFGMRLKLKHSVTQQWDVDFGGAPHGLKLAAGEEFCSARLRFFLREDHSPHELFAEFGAMLVNEGIIPDPVKKNRPAWWSEPLYCTWGDQWMQANKIPAVSLADQTAESAAPATEVLNEALVWKAVEVIKRERLPIRTIVLDEGWAVARGDWRPHPDRLPDLRRLVDELHAQGFKVMVWWNWAEISTDAQPDPAYLADAGRWKNKHRARWRDYSDTRVQEAYLKPLFRKLFSSEPGCYDLDGVKTDFLADKVHPETPVADPLWRGEERYFYRITQLFYEEMRRYKPEAMHLGGAGHYWLADLIDVNRTYDVHSSNWREHEERARMLMCTSPGAIPSYDMMTCTENTDRWFESARRLGAAVEIGNVLHVRDDLFTRVRPADDAYWALLRTGTGARPTR